MHVAIPIVASQYSRFINLACSIRRMFGSVRRCIRYHNSEFTFANCKYKRPRDRVLIWKICVSVALAQLGGQGVFAGSSSQFWTNAEDVHNCVVGNFLTSYNSYRIEPFESAQLLA